MNDFFDFNDWFTVAYRSYSDSRFFTFKTALNLLLQQPGKNIVETGTIRLKDDWGGGMSTVLFGDFASHYDYHVWTVDIAPEAIQLCKEITTNFTSHITYVVNDSVEFLRTFNQTINLLYLDSMDCPEYDAPDSPNLQASQQHQLKEIQAAWDKLSSPAIILLDDNWFSNGGKAKLTKEFLERQSCRCVLSFQQSLWMKP